MANLNDINLGSTINGQSAFLIKDDFNGEVVFDGAIQPAVNPCVVNFSGDKTKCVLSGTFCSVKSNTDKMNELVLADATKKGADITNCILSKVKGVKHGYNKTNKEVQYYYFNDNETIAVYVLHEGLRFKVQSTEALSVGDLCCNDYSDTKGASIKKAVSGDTAFLRVIKNCDANGMAVVEVCQKQVIA